MVGLLAVALMLGACSSLSTAGEPPPAAMLRVTIAPPAGDAVYIEGSARYLRMTGGAVDQRIRLNDGAPTAISLPAGSYRLESWARPCDGTCDHLDGPTDRCTGTFALVGEQTTAIEITAPPGKACAFAIIQPSAAQ